MTQDDAFQVLTIGKNVFLTGPAGSGKTFVLNRYIRWLRSCGIEPAVTASTGIAATHLGGLTIHSWSGIGIKEYLSEYDKDRIAQTERLVKRFRDTRVLIIDEVSMLSVRTLELVDQAIQAGLQSHEPFGGMQVVLCGDFFQLPPVVRGNERVTFAFEGRTWRALDLQMCYLEEQHRQDDASLESILNAIRNGTVRDTHVALVESRRVSHIPESIPHLYTHNSDVDAENNARLAKLTGKSQRYDMNSKGSHKYVEVIKKGVLAPETLVVKVGAVVMFVKNDPSGQYVNGTLGTVTSFTEREVHVKTHDGRRITAEFDSWKMMDGDSVRAEVVQIPLRLAWAVTVHKSQGLTLDAAHIDLSKTFVPGQGYVALSRLRALAGLYLSGLSDLAFARHDVVAEHDERFQAGSARVVHRLRTTPSERLILLRDEFIARIGGHAPSAAVPQVQQSHEKKKSTYVLTKELIKKGYTVEKIAAERQITHGTVISHVERLLAQRTLTQRDIARWKPRSGALKKSYKEIMQAFASSDERTLTSVRQKLKYRFTFDELRFMRLFTNEQELQKSE